MSQHTQGPWIVAPSSNKGNGSGWRDIHSTGGEFSPSYVGEALEQDARLIAAAPDLLAAIRAILFQINQGSVLERDACIAQARAAYIKATKDA